MNLEPRRPDSHSPPASGRPAEGGERLEAGVQVGDFRIEERLGAGGMGIVYRARQVSLDRQVALKVLGQALTRREDVLRFQREAQAAARLKHPGIASVYFIGQDGHVCYMAMELIDGLSLRRIIERLRNAGDEEYGPDAVVARESVAEQAAAAVRFDAPTEESPYRPPDGGGPEPSDLTEAGRRVRSSAKFARRCAEIVRDAARAIAHAHAQGVVHRDLKPENLLLDRAGQVHVIDFGIARFFEDTSITFTGQLVGTPMFMSPEQVSGRLDVDHRTDVYSLGLVLYELLTLCSPFPADSREVLLRHIATKSLTPTSWRNRAIPTDLESIVHKATARDADERYQHAEELAADLERFREGKPVLAPPYRYRLDTREIVAARPAGVLAAAFVFFLASVLTFIGAVGVSGLILAEEGDSAGGLVAGLGLVSVVMIGGFLIGRALLGGRRWAWFLGLLAAVVFLAGSLYFGGSFVANMLKVVREQRDLPEGIDLQNALAGMLPMLSVFLLAAGCASGVLVVLLSRTTRRWFRFARRVKLEYQALRTAQD